jgi:predicted amidohydrolase
MKISTQDLTVAALQTDLFWEREDKNIDAIQDDMNALRAAVDLIVLPEMWATGFSMRPQLVAMEWRREWSKNVDKWPAPLQAMLRWSQQHQAAVTGSLACKLLDHDQFVNRCFFVTPEKTLKWYDKRHLFSFAGENQVYTSGMETTTVDWRGWKLNLQVCYDLRFPVFSRNNEEEPYDIAIYVANWPQARSDAWKALLKARAIENQCYVVGVNRVGADGNGVPHDGNSGIIHPKGQSLASAENGQKTWITTGLSAQELMDFREKFPVLLDADSFELKRTRSAR